MNWFEKSTKRTIQHRLGSTYQMSLLLELFLALLSLVLIADKISSLSVFFGILAVLVAARIIFLYAVMSLRMETRIVYGIMLLLQALISTILFFSCKYLYICSGFNLYRAAVPYFYTCLLSKNGMD